VRKKRGAPLPSRAFAAIAADLAREGLQPAYGTYACVRCGVPIMVITGVPLDSDVAAALLPLLAKMRQRQPLCTVCVEDRP